MMFLNFASFHVVTWCLLFWLALFYCLFACSHYHRSDLGALVVEARFQQVHGGACTEREDGSRLVIPRQENPIPGDGIVLFVRRVAGHFHLPFSFRIYCCPMMETFVSSPYL